MTADVTHAAGLWGPHVALCGERWPGPGVTDPSCMACIARQGNPDEDYEGDIQKILVDNSVKDMQEMEDKKFLNEIEGIIEASKTR